MCVSCYFCTEKEGCNDMNKDCEYLFTFIMKNKIGKENLQIWKMKGTWYLLCVNSLRYF